MLILTKGKNEQNNVGEDSLANVIRYVRKVCVNPASGMVTQQTTQSEMCLSHLCLSIFACL